jgi:hypothetical protein
MADSELLKAQKEAAEKAQKDSAKQLAAINGLLAKETGSAKDRVKLLKMQADLKQTQQTLSGDLGKNISDMKDGFASTVNGMINQTFGPLGGMMTSLTTGFFKRGKENRENITQNELQNDNAKEMIEKLGGIQTAVEGDEKRRKGGEDKDVEVDSAANGGEVEVPSGEGEGFSMLLGRFLLATGAAVAGLAAGAAAGLVVQISGWVASLGKGVMKLIKMIPTPKWLDEVIDALKNFGGNAFTKIKNFFVGETSVFKRVGNTVDTVTDSIKGFKGSLFTKISNFFTGEASVFKRVGTIVDTVTGTVKNFTGGIFTKIGTFFKNIQPKFLTDIIDAGAGALKSFKMSGGTRVFSSIGDMFKSVSGIGDTLMSPIKSVMNFFPGGGAAKGGGGIISKILGFLLPFGDIFKNFAKFGAKLIAPLNIILGIFDAGFEAKDAVEKSDGFFASLLNGIIGALGGFIDGAVLSLLDLVKDGVSWVAGKFGFEEIEKSLDSFSFSEIFNNILDSIYAFVNKIFNKPGELVDAGVGAVKDAASSGFQFLKSAVGFGDDKPEGKLARGGFIVNKPTYLPNSGVVVGEHGTYSGRGAAAGGIADGGPEAVIPLSSSRAGAFIDPMARSVAGQVMNQLQMERMSGGGMEGASVVTGNDMSSNQVNNNTTVINSPSPIGQMLPDEGRDFVSKVA